MNRQQMAALRARLVSAKNVSPENLTAEANVPMIQSPETNVQNEQQNPTEAQVEGWGRAVRQTPSAGSPTPKSRPRRKRHYVVRSADGKCELLYVDMHAPGVAEQLYAKFDMLPGAFRTREIAEWYIDNAAALPLVKCATDARKAYVASAALLMTPA